MEQFKFDIQLIFAILNGKVSTAINRKLSRNFRQNGIEISPEQWTILLSLWEKDGVTQQELCNATFKDKPSMTRLIDNMERQHLVVRISDKRDRRTNLIHLTKTGRELEGKAFIIANQTLKEGLEGVSMEDLKTGMKLKGTVRNVIDFGVFVDIGVHQDGLVHISEITGERLAKIEDAKLKEGDSVYVKYMGVDKRGKTRFTMVGIDQKTGQEIKK